MLLYFQYLILEAGNITSTVKNLKKAIKKVDKDNSENEIVDKIQTITLDNVLNSDNVKDFDSTLALIIILNKLVDLYEKKNYIPRNMAKPYAIVSNTNQVQKDLINEIIKMRNDEKGLSKKMLKEIIEKLLVSIRKNIEPESSGILSRIRNRF